MLRKRFVRSSAVLAGSFLSLLPHGVVRAQDSLLTKRLRESVLSPSDLSPLSPSTPLTPLSPSVPLTPLSASTMTAGQQHFQWKTGIVTTTFWVGENATKNNP